MDITGQFIRGLVILIVIAAALGWLLVRWLRTTREGPGRLVLKWVLTALVCVFILAPLAPLGAQLTTRGQGGAFLLVFVAAGGLILAIIWTPTVVNWISGKFEDLFTGGGVPPTPEPFYSVAQARRKQGKFEEAIEAVQGQLEMFPRDVTGHLMLAEIHARDLYDMDSARLAIERFVDQPGHAPRNVAMALMTLADWHLQIDQNVAAARQALARIQELLPDTEQALVAGQRLAHLGNEESRASHRDRRPLTLRPGATSVGLMADSASPRKEEEDPEERVARLLNQLEDYPQDWEAREKLAVLYASHYRDLDLAADQLNILMGYRGQPARNIVRWLNLLADLQIEGGEPEMTVRATLERKIALNPAGSAGDRARQRQAHLKLHLRGLEKCRVMKLGTYEQNIGLKMKMKKERGASEPPEPGA